MKRIGFTKSTMPEERRIALMPGSLKKIARPQNLYFEEGYGELFGILDEEYLKQGSKIIPREGMSNLEILCIPKRWVKDKELFRENLVLWGWLYVTQTPWLANVLIEKKMTAIAFEEMYYGKRHYVFHKNRRITGEVGMMHALSYAGRPLEHCRAAVLGDGIVGKAAMEVIYKHRIKYELFKQYNITHFFERLHEWDMIVNCVKWTSRDNYLIKEEHIQQMKEGCFIVDISSEGIEGSIPQSIYSPVYRYKHIMIYNNEHIPSLWPRYASEQISQALVHFVNDLVAGIPNKILENATVVLNGKIIEKS